ncbi:MAG: hypothetical protein R2764_13010 [Bacteroidales bacterium]
MDGNLTVDDWEYFNHLSGNNRIKIETRFIQFDIDWSEFYIYVGDNTQGSLIGFYENDRIRGQ